MRKTISLLLTAWLTLLSASCTEAPPPPRKLAVLVFTKTAGYRHASIPDGVAAIRELGSEGGFRVDHTEDATRFSDAGLSGYDAIVFLSTTGDVLNDEQQLAFQRFAQSGGGFVGIHAATDTEYDWSWFTRLVGAQFLSHPHIQEAEQVRTSVQHRATNFLPKRWRRNDEWYDFKRVSNRLQVLLTLDESTYEGGKHGDTEHPSAWFHEYDGARVFYTAGGHTSESFSEPLFRRHILEGIHWVLEAGPRDPKRALPADDYFEVETVLEDLHDPIVFDVAPDGAVFVLEREGVLKYFATPQSSPVTHKLEAAHRGNPEEGAGQECGGLGLLLDPDFSNNGQLYLYYSPLTPSVNRLSRFRFDGSALVDEQVILEVPTDRESMTCHEGGTIAFGPDGCLYLSTGDNTNPFESDGYAPIDERPERKWFDAQRSSGNSNDLRGSILRIRLQPDGTYDIPAGNLWPPGTAKTRPEIYVKGTRNPYRMSIDPKTGHIYWGDVGPDAADDRDGSTRGYDEFNQARNAGFFGWPYFRGGRPYRDHDFASGSAGPSFATQLYNDSPNNTGLATLPQAVAPMFAYPYADSTEYPELGSGGRNAMAGPVFHRDLHGKHWPSYFDQVVTFYDWSRSSIFLVRLDEDQRLVTLNRFLKDLELHHPIDMRLGPDGWLYILEYGSTWWFNKDGRLRRVRFGGYNRRPRARASASPESGSVPLQVSFSSDGSVDPDGAELTYQWNFGDGKKSNASSPTHEFQAPGLYRVQLAVTDAGGKSSTSSIDVLAGNTAPTVSLALDPETGNTFSWGAAVRYNVEVRDVEDGDKSRGHLVEISPGAPGKLRVTAQYLPNGRPSDNEESQPNPLLGNMNPQHKGTPLLLEQGCTACHHGTRTSTGPAFEQIAQRFAESNRSREEAVARLSDRVQRGSVGSWGDTAMPAYAHVPRHQIEHMVDAILELSEPDPSIILGEAGKILLPPQPLDNASRQGVYAIRAQYTDGGASQLPSITVLSHPLYLEALEPVADLPTPLEAPLELGSNSATIAGDGAQYEEHNIGYYSGVETRLVWKVRSPTPQAVRVTALVAAPKSEAGSKFVVRLGQRELRGTVPETKGWQDYAEVELGEILVPAGDSDLEFVPRELQGTYVANVKGLRLESTR